ncbi:hypothetical protein CPC08DRAFT_716051 [Agrocybe pediades]|nr:hypothetical protein CPC08DRAFT_716051 [Agrocybe pediades]
MHKLSSTLLPALLPRTSVILHSDLTDRYLLACSRHQCPAPGAGLKPPSHFVLEFHLPVFPLTPLPSYFRAFSSPPYENQDGTRANGESDAHSTIGDYGSRTHYFKGFAMGFW